MKKTLEDKFDFTKELAFVKHKLCKWKIIFFKNNTEKYIYENLCNILKWGLKLNK